MRGLSDLLRTPDGRRFLERRGVLDDPAAFAMALRPPARGSLLADRLGLPRDARPVYVGQQVQVDYPPSVVAKFEAAARLDPGSGARPVGVWMDTDRTGSHKGQTAAVLPSIGRADRSIRLAPRRFRGREVRFVPVDEERLRSAMAALAVWVRELPPDLRDRAEARRADLAEALLGTPVGTLAGAGRSVASFLLARSVEFDAPGVFVSELARWGLLTDRVSVAVARVDDLVIVFNAALESLVARDVNPMVRPLGEDYLPLHYSCPVDGTRQRLRREHRGADRFAVTSCVCGRDYRFPLGGSPPLGDLLATDRWSVDVTIPLYLNGLASGVVAGQSSALYGLVLNEVVEKVLGEPPIPVLVPPDLPEVLADEHRPTLLVEYLTGP